MAVLTLPYKIRRFLLELWRSLHILRFSPVPDYVSLRLARLQVPAGSRFGHQLGFLPTTTPAETVGYCLALHHNPPNFRLTSRTMSANAGNNSMFGSHARPWSIKLMLSVMKAPGIISPAAVRPRPKSQR